MSPSSSDESLLTLLHDCHYQPTLARYILLRPLLASPSPSTPPPLPIPGERDPGEWGLGRWRMEDWPGWPHLDALHPSMQMHVDAFTAARRAAEQAEVQRLREDTRHAFDAACAIIHYRPTTAASAKPVQALVAAAEEEEDEEAVVPSPSPSEPEIDVSTLRHVIDRLVDATDRTTAHPRGPLTNGDASHTPLPSPPLSPTSTSAVLHALQTVLSHQHDWLDKVKAALTAISKGRDSGVTLPALLALLEEAETTVPLMTSKEKKKLQRVVERCEEWRARWKGLYDRVRRGERLDAEGRMKLAELARVVKEYDKNCGSVAMEEVSWYRAVLDLAKRLIGQVNERVKRDVKEEEDDEAEEEVLLSSSERRAQRRTKGSARTPRGSATGQRRRARRAR